MAEEWWPSEKEYVPGISKDEWLKLLKDEKVFNFNSLCMMKRFLHHGGEATCAELAKKYGRTASSYQGISLGLAQRIKGSKTLKCNQPPEGEENARWWPILYVGRRVTKDDIHEGVYIWKLRPELKAALEEINLLNDEKYPLYDQKHDWKILLSEYRKLLEKEETQKVAFDDEEYKWKTITYANEKSWKEILLYLLGKTEEAKSPSNLFYYSALNNAKVFLDDVRLDSVMDSLCDEKADLNARLKKFDSDINNLTANLEKNYARPDDERSASVFLTCKNPREHTFYKPSYYEKLCNYLEIEQESAGNKYSHYLSLIEDFERAVIADAAVMDFYKNHTSNYVESTKLIAQNIIYVLFESGRNLVNLSKGVPEMSKTTELANLLLHTHNLILHGAPGTGKTHLAKEIAQEMKAEWEMVQFHPSYDYTDFVEGLRPVKTDDGNQIGFERKDGVFKAFCGRALKNFLDSKKSMETLQEEKSIEEKMDEFIANAIDNKTKFEIATGNKFYIDRTTEKSIVVSIPANEKVNELSLSKSELTSLLSTDKKIENGNDVKEFFSRKWRMQQDSYTIVLYREIKKIKAVSQAQTVQKIEEKPFLFIIDEINRGEISKIFGELFFSIDPGYRGEKGKISTQYQNLIEAGDAFVDGFFVPENVYIIGTMNDIDRSVESMDFAFRRRFTFCEIKANENLGMLDELEEAIREEAKARLLNLNEAISKIEGLSSAYHIGGAYFLKLKELENDFDSLWNYHLKGLLREYLRGMEDADALLEKLKSAYENRGSDSELA